MGEARGVLSGAEVERHHKTLRRFVEVYCQHHHQPAPGAVCDECQELIDYARGRLQKCPFDPKPKCKECPAHCYNKAHRQRIREVMRFSGMYFVLRGRVDWLAGYFLGESLPGPLGRAASALPHVTEGLAEASVRLGRRAVATAPGPVRRLLDRR